MEKNRGFPRSGGIFDADRLKVTLEQIDAQSQSPEFWKDSDREAEYTPQREPGVFFDNAGLPSLFRKTKRLHL